MKTTATLSDDDWWSIFVVVVADSRPTGGEHDLARVD
jgi:hypothetical protein